MRKKETGMKYLSLKAKLTLLYTLLMTSVVCIIVIILFSFSNQEILTGVSSQLEERVAEAQMCIRDSYYLCHKKRGFACCETDF